LSRSRRHATLGADLAGENRSLWSRPLRHEPQDQAGDHYLSLPLREQKTSSAAIDRPDMHDACEGVERDAHEGGTYAQPYRHCMIALKTNNFPLACLCIVQYRSIDARCLTPRQLNEASFSEPRPFNAPSHSSRAARTAISAETTAPSTSSLDRRTSSISNRSCSGMGASSIGARSAARQAGSSSGMTRWTADTAALCLRTMQEGSFRCGIDARPLPIDNE